MNLATVIVSLFCIVVNTTAIKWEFPAYFKFGAASSAYQIEGGYQDGGKGESFWDYTLNNNPNFTVDHSNGNVACDSYHKWQEDIEMLKNLSVNYYRFSIAWTRIFPYGFATEPNVEGVEYYNNLINGLLENGIEPLVTIYHWDTPQMFEPLGSIYSPIFINYFTDYADYAFKIFGDRVKTWITFNEPQVVCQDYNELIGSGNPYYPNGIIEYQCSDVLIRAHVKAYHLYNTKYRLSQKGKVGITLNFEWTEPATDSPEDEEAAEQTRQFEFGLYANPIVYGDYPQIVIERVANRSRREGFPRSRLPKFTLADKLQNRGAYDFIGLNQYNSWLVKAVPDAPIGTPSVPKDIGTVRFVNESWQNNGVGGKVFPLGLRHALQWLKKTYHNSEILITECGYPDETGILDDDDRISVLQQFLNATLQALLEDKVNVRSFTVWSLMDDFEWVQGYTYKYGLYDVNFTSSDRVRTPRKSATFYKEVIETRKLK